MFAVLITYAPQIAKAFHSFYDHCQVLGSDFETSRLHLCRAARNALTRGLSLLGVPVVHRL